MRIDRRLVLIGVMLVVLSMTMATQYATTRVGYTFGIVHPSKADIRFIASDNSSDDGERVLRITDNSSGAQYLTVNLGDFSPNQWKNYTAAFGIVNEEDYDVNITHINITGINNSYITIWLHGDRDANYMGDGAQCVKAVNGGSALFTTNDTIWTLAAGDGNTGTICADGDTQLNTEWDTGANVQWSENDANNSQNQTSDFVWVGISLSLPPDAANAADSTGDIYINFKSTT